MAATANSTEPSKNLDQIPKQKQSSRCLGNTKNSDICSLFISYLGFWIFICSIISKVVYLCTIIMVYLIIQLHKQYHHFTSIMDSCLETICNCVLAKKGHHT
eukprot:229133_1